MEKVSEKQGSSAVDISIPVMAAFFRHCSRAAAVSHPDKHSIVTGHCLGCRAVIWTSIILEGLSTTSNPRASLMPTKQETAQLQHHSTVQGKWFTRVCPVRTNPKSGCCQQSTAAGITMPEAKCVEDSWSCESDDESADDTNTTSRKSCLHHSQIGLEQIRKLARKKWLPLCLALGESCAWKTRMVTLKISILSSQKRLDFQASWLSCFSSMMQQMLRKCTFAISCWASCSSKPHKTKHLVTNQCPTHQLHQQNRAGDDTSSSHCLRSSPFK